MRKWVESLRQFTRPGLRSILCLGFSAGLPFLLVFSTLTAWLTQAGIKRAAIGSFAWVGLTYTLKIVWAPVVDRVRLPVLGSLGRRRSWMMLGQCGIALGLAQIALRDPATELGAVACLAVFVAFCSATQDIALDAFRIETPPVDHQEAKAAAYQFGYRVALIVAGAGALLLASAYGWPAAYLCMAALGLIGPLTTWLIQEPDEAIDRRTIAQEQRVIDFLEKAAHWPDSARNVASWFIGAVVCPFVDFFNRYPVRHALLILLFIGVYRLTDYTMGAMANNFYLSLGFTLNQIAGVSKLYGVIMTILGTAFAGGLMVRHGILRTLLMGTLVIFVANLFYAWMASARPGLPGLVTAISLDNFGIGIAGTAFIAYLSGLTSAAYTATQYALFGSLWPLLGKFIAGYSGNVVDAIDYPAFFVYSALLSLPGIVLLAWLMRQPQEPARARA